MQSIESPDVPAVDCFQWLIDFLFEVGPLTDQGGVISYTDIRNCMDVSGIDLDSEECRMVRGLSAEYALQASKSYDPKCPAPYRTEAPAKQETKSILMRRGN